MSCKYEQRTGFQHARVVGGPVPRSTGRLAARPDDPSRSRPHNFKRNGPTVTQMLVASGAGPGRHSTTR